MLNISIKAEPLFQIAGIQVTNSLVTAIIVLLILFLVARFYANQLNASKKNLIFYLMHSFIEGLYSLFHGVAKEKTNVFFPLVGAFFFYILFQNWFGLLPGVGSVLVKPAIAHHEAAVQKTESAKPAAEEKVPLLRAGTSDLNTTLALGLISVIAIQFFGIKYLGFGGYISKFINLRGPIDFALGLLEVVSEISRVISFAFRLFGNIFAGEVLLAVIAYLIPVLVSLPFFMMEIFVGFIQALVFSMLTIVLLQMATVSHGHGNEHH